MKPATNAKALGKYIMTKSEKTPPFRDDVYDKDLHRIYCVYCDEHYMVDSSWLQEYGVMCPYCGNDTSA